MSERAGLSPLSHKESETEVLSSDSTGLIELHQDQENKSQHAIVFGGTTAIWLTESQIKELFAEVLE